VNLQINQEGSSLTAIITFENELVVKTALLLNGALIGNQSVIVTAQQPEKASATMPNEKAVDKKQSYAVDVISSILAAGYVLGAGVLQKAQAVDEKYGISQKVITKATELDQQYKVTETVTEKAKAVDEKLKLTDKANQVLQNQNIQTAIKTTSDTIHEIQDATNKKIEEKTK